MSRFVTLDNNTISSAKLKVVGVGGGGCNAIESMIKRGLSGVEYVAVNTDSQALQLSSADHKVQIGTSMTRGLGAGADPNVGKKALEEDREKIENILQGSDMVFVTAGMGGGTGTGAAPLVAGIAKSLGSLVVGIVTKPFKWEGKKRMMNAESGINEFKRAVDSLIIIPNERLLNILDNTVTASAAFDKPNEVLYEATRGIADIITITGIINVDFADVRSVMNESGEALMGCGIASGANRAVEAAQKAISSPLLEGINIKGAKNILLNVTGSEELTMQEIEEGNNVIYDAAGEEANVIFGWVKKEEMNEYVSYTVIATGFNTNSSAGTFVEPVQKVEEERPKPESGFTKPAKETFEEFGYTFNTSDFDDPARLDIPTFHRVKSPSAKLNEPAEDSQEGFKFEKLDSFREKPEITKKETPPSDKEDSSSFLSMMMD